jgi:hypothetical protein
MIHRHFFLFLLLLSAHSAYPQASARPVAIPSPEAFVNAVFHTVVGASWSHYYLIAGTDSSRFTKYDYDEWVKYTLKEQVPLPVMNELSEKVYHSRTPYFWKQDSLQMAICITRKQGDSILYPAFNRRSPYDRRSKKESRKKAARDPIGPDQDRYVFSFSLPQFTDDGQYAVIDLNFVCGVICGEGFTCLFHRSPSGWKLIGQYVNWSS